MFCKLPKAILLTLLLPLVMLVSGQDGAQSFADRLSLPSAKWLLSCLPQGESLADLEPVLTCTEEEQLLARWNKAQDNLRLLATEDMLLLVAKHGHGNPILGAFNRRTATPLLQGEALDWELEYENAQKENLRLSPSTAEFQTAFRKDGKAQAFTVSWKTDGFAVTMPVRLDGARLESSLTVDNLTHDQLLTHVVFPRFRLARLPGQDRMVLPYLCGQFFDNPTVDLQVSDWMYPGGAAALQMCCYYNEEGQGVYLGFEDALARTKILAVRGKDGQIWQEWKHPVAYKSAETPAGNSFSCGAAKAVLELYAGDWYEAGRIYRRFAETAPWWIADLTRTTTPEWFRNNPLWIMGLDPTNGVMPVEGYRYLNEYFEVPVAHVSGLLGSAHGPWRLGPDFKFHDHIADSFPRLHALGVHFVPYYNERLWNCDEGADQENGWSTRGEPYAIRHRDGSLAKERYTKLYAVMCPAAKNWQDHLLKTVETLAEGGIDGLYHDQLPTARPHVCYAANHGHLPGDPASYLSQGHWLTYGEGIMEKLRRQYPNLVHTGEDGSEPYLKCLDGFMVWCYGLTRHVPLFQSIYAPRIQFVGRGCFSAESEYASFFPKYGEQLVFGEQIGWVNFNTVRYPSPLRSWLKKLALLRYDLAEFLNSSEMQKSLHFQQPPETLTATWGIQGKNICTTDKILHGVWKHKDGRLLVIFLNTVNEPQTVLPSDSLLADRTAAILAEGRDPLFVSQGSSAPAVILKPYEAQLWLLSAKPDQAWTDRHARVMQKIATVMDDLGLLLNDRSSFAERKELDATKHEFIRLKDASWLLGACRFSKTTLGYSPSSAPDNWAVCPDKSCVYFGHVDFGEGGFSRLEGEFACDRQGVVVEMVDLTLDHPHEVLATFNLRPGGWYDYQTVSAVLARPVYGKRDIMFRISGGNCNFKGWRAL